MKTYPKVLSPLSFISKNLSLSNFPMEALMTVKQDTNRS